MFTKVNPGGLVYLNNHELWNNYIHLWIIKEHHTTRTWGSNGSPAPESTIQPLIFSSSSSLPFQFSRIAPYLQNASTEKHCHWIIFIYNELRNHETMKISPIVCQLTQTNPYCWKCEKLSCVLSLSHLSPTPMKQSHAPASKFAPLHSSPSQTTASLWLQQRM